MGADDYRIVTETLLGYLPDGTEMYCIVAFGNSDKTKPTTASNGGVLCDCSACVEADTGKVFFWDEHSSNWVEQ